jgi:GR25 family glycosyltransferase involved in LPS biosynthesis
MTLNNYVDKIFVINLPHRKDRLERFEQLSKIYNFEYEVFEAFNGKEKIDSNFEYEGVKVSDYRYYYRYDYFRSQIGCLISHLNLIKHCRQMNLSKVMIFEDDCGFHENFDLRLDNLMSKVNPDWQLLYLSGSVPEFISDHDGYSKISKILTTHSYMIKSEIFDLVINNFKSKIFIKEVDMCYSDIHTQCNSYVAMPFLTFQEDGYSDIASEYRSYPSIKKHL